MIRIRSLIPIVALSTLIAGTAPAAAETRQQTVSFADLDLTSPAGIATLDRRIDTAVRKVCGRAASLKEMSEQRHCRKQALADVQPRRSYVLASRSSQVQLAARAR